VAAATKWLPGEFEIHIAEGFGLSLGGWS